MEYNIGNSVSGEWLKGADVKSGTPCTIINETTRQESQFKDDEGKPKTQDVAKLKIDGKELNVSLNKPTLKGLVSAFGKESKDWIGKPLTAQTEKAVIGGKRVTILYLVPEGYELEENEEGYVNVEPKNTVTGNEKDESFQKEDDGLDQMAGDIPF